MIEKTVGNTLRVGYVAEIVPRVRFVHVIRDGVDVVDSSRIQWQTPPDTGYLREKIRHFPLRLAPYLRAQVRHRRGPGPPARLRRTPVRGDLATRASTTTWFATVCWPSRLGSGDPRSRLHATRSPRSVSPLSRCGMRTWSPTQ